jgi:hypothetical protein
MVHLLVNGALLPFLPFSPDSSNSYGGAPRWREVRIQAAAINGSPPPKRAWRDRGSQAALSDVLSIRAVEEILAGR